MTCCTFLTKENLKRAVPLRKAHLQYLKYTLKKLFTKTALSEWVWMSEVHFPLIPNLLHLSIRLYYSTFIYYILSHIVGHRWQVAKLPLHIVLSKKVKLSGVYITKKVSRLECRLLRLRPGRCLLSGLDAAGTRTTSVIHRNTCDDDNNSHRHISQHPGSCKPSSPTGTENYEKCQKQTRESVM